MKKTLLAVFVASNIVACGGPSVSWDTQEQQRKTARENGEYNAMQWRNSNAPKHSVKSRGDSTISETCAQGDGWASVDLVLRDKDGRESMPIALKCSTASEEIGCMEKDDFQSRPQYASQEGQCNKNLPVPMPKLTGK